MPNGNQGLLLSVDNLRPSAGSDIVFDLVFRNMVGEGSSGSSIMLIKDSSVKVELSRGLMFKPGWTPPTGFVKTDSQAAIWRPPDTDNDARTPAPVTHEIEILAQLTADSLDSIPLEERCITAWVESSSRPPPARDFAMGSLKQCLGNDPPVLFEEGPIGILTSFPCVADAGPHQCQTAPGVAIAADIPASNLSDYNSRPIESRLRSYGIGRRDAGLTSVHGRIFLDPETVIIQIKDPQGRVRDTNRHRAADVSWQTARDAHADIGYMPVEGVEVAYTRRDIRDAGAWNSLGPRTLTAKGVGGGNPPGGVKIRLNAGRNTFFDLSSPNYSATRKAFPINTVSNSVVQYFLDFERPGTYLIDYSLTMTDSSDTAHRDKGTYTFHVGPIAELGVREGPAGLAPAGQRAFVIEALNRGPDDSPPAQVSLAGLTVDDIESYQATLGELTCDPDCVWTIEDGEGRGVRNISPPGFRDATNGELLVVSLKPGASGEAVASIDYVSGVYAPCIAPDAMDAAPEGTSAADCAAAGGTRYEGTWYDFDSRNDQATITALTGTGEAMPGNLRAQIYPQPPVVLVQWEPVERVYGASVSHYEVWVSPETCQLPGEGDTPEVTKVPLFLDDELRADLLPYCYYVRAVNEFGIPGFWSEPAVASDGTQVTPKLSVRGEAAVTEGETARFTVTAFPPPVDPITINYTVTQQGDFVASGDLGQKHDNDGLIMDDTGRAVITVPTVQDEVDEANGSVTVTLNNGDGYTVSSAGSGSVTVLDDETSTAYFGQVSCPDCGETVGEDVGVANVEVTVWPAPATDLAINYTIDTTVTDAATPGDDFRINGSGRASGSVTVRAGESKVNIPVQVIDDPDSENAEEVVITIADGEGYELGDSTKLTYTLTVEDNDGPRAEFAVEESTPGEGAGTHNVQVELSMPAPSGGLTINYTADGDAVAGTDYNISGLTGRDGSVTVPAMQTSVNIPVSIIQDTDNEGDEELTLTLRPSPGLYTVGSAKVHKVTILDDDRPRASFASASTSPNPHEGAGIVYVRVNLDPAAPTGGLTVSYGVGGDAIRNRDYTVPNTVWAAAGDAFVDIPVTITDDGHSEAEETVILTLRAGSDYTVGTTGEHTLTIADNDPPGVAFARAEDSVRENAGTYRAVINLEPGPHEDITVSYSIANRSTAVSPADYDISNSGSVDVKAGSGRVEIPISITDDQVAERAETLILTLQAGNGYNVVGTHEFTLTIEDDDAPVVTFQAPGGSVAEDGGSHTVTVQLDRTLAADVVVHYDVRGSATRDTDYTITGNTVTVPAGQRTADITVNITDDEENEANERVILTLNGDGRPYTLGTPNRYTLVIEDDDDAVGETTFPVVSSVDHRTSNPGDRGECQVNEQEGQCFPTFYVDHGGAELPDDFELVILYAGGTATLNEDFEFVRFRLGEKDYGVANPPQAKDETFTLTKNDEFKTSGGVTLLRISGLRFIRDGKSESAETIEFQVVNGPGYTLREPTGHTVTIRD